MTRVCGRGGVLSCQFCSYVVLVILRVFLERVLFASCVFRVLFLLALIIGIITILKDHCCVTLSWAQVMYTVILLVLIVSLVPQ